jgi:hypothetical protein
MGVEGTWESSWGGIALGRRPSSSPGPSGGVSQTRISGLAYLAACQSLLWSREQPSVAESGTSEKCPSPDGLSGHGSTAQSDAPGSFG